MTEILDQASKRPRHLGFISTPTSSLRFCCPSSVHSPILSVSNQDGTMDSLGDPPMAQNQCRISNSVTMIDAMQRL